MMNADRQQTGGSVHQPALNFSGIVSDGPRHSMQQQQQLPGLNNVDDSVWRFRVCLSRRMPESLSISLPLLACNFRNDHALFASRNIHSRSIIWKIISQTINRPQLPMPRCSHSGRLMLGQSALMIPYRERVLP